MKLVIGLGNVGPQFAHTRHNLGFMITSHLADRYEASFSLEPKFMAGVADFHLNDERIIVAQPQTMMNLSGEAVRRLAEFYKLEPADVWVIHDDMDVPFGRLRMRAGGGAGGHNGIASIIEHLGAGFVRIRAGIGLNNRDHEPSESYVLKPFTEAEQAHLPVLIEQASTIVATALERHELQETTFDLI
jgi:peptidyl-tRNA hydrolase, PTH1 family